MCWVELNWRFYERSKLTFVLPGKWFSDRSAKIPRDFELNFCIENNSKQVWRRVKMRSVGEDDIVWIVDTSCKLPLSYILEFFTSVSYHNVRNSAVVMTYSESKCSYDGRWHLVRIGPDRIGSTPIILSLSIFCHFNGDFQHLIQSGPIQVCPCLLMTWLLGSNQGGKSCSFESYSAAHITWTAEARFIVQPLSALVQTIYGSVRHVTADINNFLHLGAFILFYWMNEL